MYTAFVGSPSHAASQGYIYALAAAAVKIELIAHLNSAQKDVQRHGKDELFPRPEGSPAPAQY